MQNEPRPTSHMDEAYTRIAHVVKRHPSEVQADFPCSYRQLDYVYRELVNGADYDSVRVLARELATEPIRTHADVMQALARGASVASTWDGVVMVNGEPVLDAVVISEKPPAPPRTPMKDRQKALAKKLAAKAARKKGRPDA